MRRRREENGTETPILGGCEAVELRLAQASDDRALAMLSQRDTRALPPKPHLVAVREGRIDAALSLATGDAIADPFRRTAELVELLRAHACGERPAPPRGERRAAARPRPRPRLVTP